jgi:hypothetical protein
MRRVLGKGKTEFYFVPSHTLAYGTLEERFSVSFLVGIMTKAEVLSIFNRSGRFMTPDEVRGQLRPLPNRRSLYSYVLRLARQGLLERRQTQRGTLAYRLTERGRARLEYLQRAR